jgi:hypothetical protein
MLQMQKPMCSEKIDKMRLRRATPAPRAAQNTSSSGLHSSIECGRADAACSARGPLATVVGVGATVVGVVTGSPDLSAGGSLLPAA